MQRMSEKSERKKRSTGKPSKSSRRKVINFLGRTMVEIRGLRLPSNFPKLKVKIDL